MAQCRRCLEESFAMKKIIVGIIVLSVGFLFLAFQNGTGEYDEVTTQIEQTTEGVELTTPL